MEAVALTLIFAGSYLLRQVAVGRVSTLKQDTADFASALLSGDGAALNGVAKRRGKNLATVAAPADSTGVAPVAGLTTPTNSVATGGSALQQYAHSQFSNYGWPDSELAPLIKLVNSESGWKPTAQNPHSTAYGLFQFLDGTWAPYGPKTANANLQIDYGLRYIHDRYGTPSKAWTFHLAHGWY